MDDGSCIFRKDSGGGGLPNPSRLVGLIVFRSRSMEACLVSSTSNMACPLGQRSTNVSKHSTLKPENENWRAHSSSQSIQCHLNQSSCRLDA